MDEEGRRLSVDSGEKPEQDTSLMERLLMEALPRPVISPKDLQLAA